MTVREAADDLAVHPRTVLSMIHSGELEAEWLGRQWVVPLDATRAVRGKRRPRGRPLSVSRAWAILFLAVGRDPAWLSRHEIARSRSYLRAHGIEALASRLGRRAAGERWRVHSSDLPRLAAERSVVLSGVSAVEHYGADLSVHGLVEGYARATSRARLRTKYRAIEGTEPNARLHFVEDVWPFSARERFAPESAVALDLLEAGDQRSRAAGEAMLRRLPSP